MNYPGWHCKFVIEAHKPKKEDHKSKELSIESTLLQLNFHISQTARVNDIIIVLGPLPDGSSWIFLWLPHPLQAEEESKDKTYFDHVKYLN